MNDGIGGSQTEAEAKRKSEIVREYLRLSEFLKVSEEICSWEPQQKVELLGHQIDF